LFAELVDRSNENFYGHHLRALPDYNICSIRFSVNPYAFLFALLLPPPGIYETRKKAAAALIVKDLKRAEEIRLSFSFSITSILEN
jgi:hypothetical protein